MKNSNAHKRNNIKERYLSPLIQQGIIYILFSYLIIPIIGGLFALMHGVDKKYVLGFILLTILSSTLTHFITKKFTCKAIYKKELKVNYEFGAHLFLMQKALLYVEIIVLKVA